LRRNWSWILTLPDRYPHDNAEGLAVLSETMIAVSNDDDFGIASDAKGGIVQKRLPGAGDTLGVNQVYFIKLPKPLK
jgi:hypothetical protein